MHVFLKMRCSLMHFDALGVRCECGLAECDAAAQKHRGEVGFVAHWRAGWRGLARFGGFWRGEGDWVCWMGLIVGWKGRGKAECGFQGGGGRLVGFVWK